MYNIGDSVMYNMNGACTVVDIVTKKIENSNYMYYKLENIVNKAVYFVPMNSSAEEKIRPIISHEKALQVFEVLSIEPANDNEHWNMQHRKNVNELKSGDIFKESIVLKRLANKMKEKPLSFNEGMVYKDAYEFVLGELMLSLEKSEAHIRRQMNKSLGVFTTDLL